MDIATKTENIKRDYVGLSTEDAIMKGVKDGYTVREFDKDKKQMATMDYVESRLNIIHQNGKVIDVYFG